MKTKLFLLTGLLCGGMILASCQKDNELAPAVQDETVAADNAANLEKSELLLPDRDYLADPIDNYPDPFYAYTNIEFRVFRPGNVTLAVYAENGLVISQIFKGNLQKGVYRISINTIKWPKGLYYAELIINGRVCKEKMTKIDNKDPMPMDNQTEN